MNATEVLSTPQFAYADPKDRFISMVGRGLQTMTMPIMEHLPESRYLSRAATAFLCSVAMWGVIEPATATAEARSLVAASSTASNQIRVSGEEVVTPSPVNIVPLVNEECGDPDYTAPKQEQIDSLLCRFNNARPGSEQLVEDPQLEAAAELKLNEDITYQHFSHSPSGNQEDPLQFIKAAKGVTGTWMMGENLAEGEGILGKVRSVFGAFRQSPPHWSNIINERFTNVGIAIKHVKRIVMDVDQESGLTMKNVLLRNVTFVAAEFWGQR